MTPRPKPKAKPAQWKAWVAVDRKTGAYLAGYVPEGGRSMEEFRAGIAVYSDPVVRRAVLTLAPPAKRTRP